MTRVFTRSPTRSRTNLKPSELREEYGLANNYERKIARLTKGSKFGAANKGRKLSKKEIKEWERNHGLKK